jgi:hypothetical protein
MKKIIVLFLLLECTTIFASVSGKVELGRQVDGRDDHAYTLFELGYKFTPFDTLIYPYGQFFCWYETTNEVMRNYPFNEKYEYGVKIQFRNFYVHGYHYCVHAVFSPIIHMQKNTNKYSEQWDEHRSLAQSFHTKTIIAIGYEF